MSRRTRPTSSSPPLAAAAAPAGRVLTNADIARQLAALAHLLSAKRENPFKIRAYRRAAESIATMPESLDELVRSGTDLTTFTGIGKGISSAIREIVLSGTLGQLDTLRASAAPEVAALSEHPRLDPKRVLRIYKQLGISSVGELREKLERGEIGAKLGPRVEHYVRQGLTESAEMLLYDADDLVPLIQRFLLESCGATRAEPTGAFRRRVEVVHELSFLVAASDFAAVVARFQRYGGRAELLGASAHQATFKLSSGVLVAIDLADERQWGLALLTATGSESHLEILDRPRRRLQKLATADRRFATEAAAYRALGLRFIEPELREGRDEVERAARGPMPKLVTTDDIRGELHSHSTSSDGAHTIEQMAAAARDRGYDYIGIADHSQSLKIAGGVSEEDLWKQIRLIDRLNSRLKGIRVLKSAEVDILVDGSLDYPDELLRELDYTVCSIHSRFGLGRAAQTERVLRAMDNPHFRILGHATGRLLLRRPGYELDIERVIAHARERGCFFEINASPDRLDLSAEHARLARDAGIKIAICTDAHSTRELDYIRCGVDQARRAGLEKADILNALSWPALRRAFQR